MLPVLSAVPVEVLTQAADGRQWWTFAAVVLSLAAVNLGAISALRAMLRRRVAFFRSGFGARVLTWLVGTLQALLLAVAGGVPVERALVLAFMATATASGGHSWKPQKRRTPAAPTQEAHHE